MHIPFIVYLVQLQVIFLINPFRPQLMILKDVRCSFHCVGGYNNNTHTHSALQM